MVSALRQADVAPSDVDYVQLHGTGTRLNDVAETNALRAVFGPRVSSLPAAATKPITGHCLGAAGAVDAIVALLAVLRGCAPPTANLEDPDPEAGLAVSRSARDVDMRVALVSSSGFGGRNAVLVLRRC